MKIQLNILTVLFHFSHGMIVCLIIADAVALERVAAGLVELHIQVPLDGWSVRVIGRGGRDGGRSALLCVRLVVFSLLEASGNGTGSKRDLLHDLEVRSVRISAQANTYHKDSKQPPGSRQRGHEQEVEARKVHEEGL